MNRDLAPTAGARFLLERTAASDSRAEYACSIVTPDATWSTTGVLTDEGAVLAACDAPVELVEMLQMFAKLTARGAAKRREDGLVVWPARVLRWRP